LQAIERFDAFLTKTLAETAHVTISRRATGERVRWRRDKAHES